MMNSLSGHIPGPVSLHRFTFKEGHLANKALGIPRVDSSTTTFSTSRARDDPIYSFDTFMPP
jgi:hypothetical protein